MPFLSDAYFRALSADDAAQLYDMAPCGYLSMSGDGTILKVNSTFLDMTGYRFDELIGTVRLGALLTTGGRIYYETHLAPMLHMGGSVQEIALDLVHRDGHVVPVLANAVAELGQSPGSWLIRVAVFDASRRREYERELLRARDRAERSEATALRLARTLQQTLIPPAPPLVPNLDLAAVYHPAGDGGDVGGDFYDVFQVSSTDWVVVLGDVCGKGAEAAVVTALARNTLRATTIDHASPAACLRSLNEVMRHYGADRFCTIVMLRMREIDGEWTGTVASGGHDLPLLRSTTGEVRRVGRYGSLLGVLDAPDLHDEAFRVRPGELLLLFTDGLTEGRRGRELYGHDRVWSMISRAHDSAGSLAQDLLRDVIEFQDGPTSDDIAMLVLRAPERPSTTR
jgi:sigma-B regulation protein RsbU (phosphoserine phosphatase)